VDFGVENFRGLDLLVIEHPGFLIGRLVELKSFSNSSS
jgi:hypothetical protein